jgi:hypothetical protein
LHAKSARFLGERIDQRESRERWRAKASPCLLVMLQAAIGRHRIAADPAADLVEQAVERRAARAAVPIR